MANWRFVAQKTDYFTQGAPPSPLQHTWSLGVEEQYYFVWPLLLIAVTLLLAARARRYFGKTTVGDVRFATFVIATLGALASAAAAIVFTSDATRDRIYFGTDTRAQALLIGAAASALLVRDWPSLNRGWCLIRTPVGAADRADVCRSSVWPRWRRSTHYATGSAGEFRHGLLIVVAIAAVLVVAPVALEQRGAVARVLALRSAGVAGHHLLRRLSVALANLSGAQRRTHRMVRTRTVRRPVRRHAWRWPPSRTGRSNNPSGAGDRHGCRCCRWRRPPSPAPPR